MKRTFAISTATIVAICGFAHASISAQASLSSPAPASPSGGDPAASALADAGPTCLTARPCCDNQALNPAQSDPNHAGDLTTINAAVDENSNYLSAFSGLSVFTATGASGTQVSLQEKDGEGFRPFRWLWKEEKETRTMHEQQGLAIKKKHKTHSFANLMQGERHSFAKQASYQPSDAPSGWSAFTTPEEKQSTSGPSFFQSSRERWGRWSDSVRETNRQHWKEFKSHFDWSSQK